MDLFSFGSDGAGRGYYHAGAAVLGGVGALKKRIVLLGPPAAGKGTQARLLAERYGFPMASTGAMLRQQRALGTELGAEADRWTSRGMFIPDALILRLVREWLTGRWNAFILDGFPRTLGQAEAFDRDLTERNAALDLIVNLSLDEDEIRSRILKRVTCVECGATFHRDLHGVEPGAPCPSCGARLEQRRDDTLEALKERFVQHQQQTVPVVEYYRRSNRLYEVDASIGSSRVFEQLCSAIEEVVAI